MKRVSLPAFWRGRRGSVAVETVVAVSLSVVAFAGVMQIVHSAWVSDRMDRAARAAARAIALAPDADESTHKGYTCNEIRKERGLGEEFDCDTELDISIESKLRPEDLLSDGGTNSDGAAGQLVLVRIAWSAGSWNPGTLVSGDDPNSRPFAIGIARLELPEGA